MSMLSVFHRRIFSTMLRGVLSVSIVILLSACSGFGGDDGQETDAKVLPPLEVPPDLVTPQGDPRLARPVLPKVKPSSKAPATSTADCRCSKPPRIGEQVLPPGKGVTRMHKGDRRWLVAEAEPEQVWPLVRTFLTLRGYRVSHDEPAIGLLETDWKPRYIDATNADEKSAGNGQSNWRESLRIRIEPAEEAGRTNIYLTQRNSQRAGKEASWELRPADEDRAVEMLNRLARYLSGENVADTPLPPLKAHIDMDDSGHTVIIAKAGFESAWRRTSLALTALGFTIEDHDRANRIFHVYNDLPSGLTEEELKYGKERSATVREDYWIHLQTVGETTHISVRNKSGTVDESQVARHLLTLLLGRLS